MRIVPFLFLAASAYAADLTGNWVVAQDMHDGTERRTYFDLKQDGARITGHIRATPFYYSIKESKGGPEAFTLVGSMMDGRNERTVSYQGKLQGDELHVAAIARTRHGEQRYGGLPHGCWRGAYPKRVDLPPLHKVR